MLCCVLAEPESSVRHEKGSTTSSLVLDLYVDCRHVFHFVSLASVLMCRVPINCSNKDLKKTSDNGDADAVVSVCYSTFQ